MKTNSVNNIKIKKICLKFLEIILILWMNLHKVISLENNSCEIF